MKKLFALLAVALLALPAVAQNVQINGAGATFPNPIYSKWFSEYNKLHSNVEINYGSIGSGGGSIAPSGGLDAPGLDQKIIRTASVDLKVKRGHFEGVWGDAQAVAHAYGGYIVSARSGKR